MPRWAGLGIVTALVLAAAPLAAEQVGNPAPVFFRIGTASTAGTYYPIGGLLAQAISAPPGARPCADAGECGVPGVVASALGGPVLIAAICSSLSSAVFEGKYV